MNAIAAACLMLIASSTLAGALERRPPVQPQSIHLAHAHLLAKLMDAQLMSVADTRSMEPVLRATDLLVIEPVRFAELSKGAIIVFKRRAHYYGGKLLEAGLICHRIVEVHDGYVITKGDNAVDDDDDKVTQRSFRGRVAYAIDGQTGDTRELRVSRNGELLSDLQALNRELRLRESPANSSALPRQTVLRSNRGGSDRTD